MSFRVPGHGRLPQPWFCELLEESSYTGKGLQMISGGQGIPGSQVPTCVTVSRIMQEDLWRNEEAGNHIPGCEFLNAQGFGMSIMFQSKTSNWI